MNAERNQGNAYAVEIDRADLLLTFTLFDEKGLATLLAGGEDKERIVKKMIPYLRDDPIAQKSLLEKLFFTISQEGDGDVTDRRDGAFAILTDKAMLESAVKNNPDVVSKAYIKAVKSQDKDRDPISGSVASLLAAGRVLAPYLIRNGVAEAWENLANQFRTPDERSQIRLGFMEIIDNMSPDLLLDNQVAELRKKNFIYTEIAERLGRNIWEITRSVRRLIAQGRTKPRGKGRPASKKAPAT